MSGGEHALGAHAHQIDPARPRSAAATRLAGRADARSPLAAWLVVFGLTAVFGPTAAHAQAEGECWRSEGAFAAAEICFDRSDGGSFSINWTEDAETARGAGGNCLGPIKVLHRGENQIAFMAPGSIDGCIKNKALAPMAPRAYVCALDRGQAECEVTVFDPQGQIRDRVMNIYRR